MVTLSYTNEHGELMVLKTDDNLKPFINHSDIHEKEEFVPLEHSLSTSIFNEGEKIAISSFMEIIKKHRITYKS